MIDDEILAIVAALELVMSRDEAPPAQSCWKLAARDYAETSPSMAPRKIHTPRGERVLRPNVASRWKSS